MCAGKLNDFLIKDFIEQLGSGLQEPLTLSHVRELHLLIFQDKLHDDAISIMESRIENMTAIVTELTVKLDKLNKQVLSISLSGFIHLGPVVQSIVRLTRSLTGQLVIKYFTITDPILKMSPNKPWRSIIGCRCDSISRKINTSKYTYLHKTLLLVASL